MKRTIVCIILVLGILLSLVMLSSCGSKESQLVGEWEYAGGGDHYFFYEDGTFSGYFGGMLSGNTYSIMNDDTLRLGTATFNYEINGDNLTLYWTVTDKAPMQFTRVK